MAVLSFAPLPAQTMAGSLTMSWLRPSSASPAMALAIRDGRCRACSTGRPGSTIPVSTFPRTRRPSMHRTGTFFLFLVDDLNPIEAGLLRDGSPDLYFRGFYCWNSEVGAKTLGMASFYLRAVCQNRNLWGVEDFEEIIIRHSKYAASRFAHEAAPALLNFANSSPLPFVNGIKAARERIAARTDEDRTEFLRHRGFSKAETAKVIDTVLAEEGRPPESIFDFVQGITAVARDKPHQDARLDMEAKAKKLLDRAA